MTEKSIQQEDDRISCDENNGTGFIGCTRRKALQAMGSASIIPLSAKQFAGFASGGPIQICSADSVTPTCGGGGVGDDNYEPAYSTSTNQRVESFDGVGDPQDPSAGFYLASNQGLTIERITSKEVGDYVVHQFVLSAVASSEVDREPDGTWESEENLNGIELAIENNQDSYTSSIFPPQQGDSRAVAATQGSGEGYLDWKAGITEAAKVAASELNLLANVVVAADDVTSAFRYDGASFGDGQSVDYMWKDFGTRQLCASSVRFYIEANNPSDGYDITVRTDIKWDHPITKIISEDDTTNIGINIEAETDVTNISGLNTGRERLTHTDHINDPVISKRAQEEDVDYVKEVSYDDQSEAVEIK